MTTFSHWKQVFLAGVFCATGIGSAYSQANPPVPALPPPPPPKELNARPTVINPPPAIQFGPNIGQPAPVNVQARPIPNQPIPAPVPAAPAKPLQPANYLAWNVDSQEVHAKVGDTNAHFTFYVTNVSQEVVLINSVRTSCGCTAAQLPEQPWKLQPGSNGPISATMNLVGKSGTIAKSVTVDTSAGIKSLLVKTHIAGAAPTVAGTQGAMSGDVERLRNMQMAMADRQVVFKNKDCAKCHAEPAHGKMGVELYNAACAICHDSPHRASMVPDLRALKHPTSPEHWKKWIQSGRPGSMMPAFSKTEGGILTEEQINSLVDYLSTTIPSVVPKTTATPPPPAKQSASVLPNLNIKQQ